MGYPMTWRRLIMRNQFIDGDYHTVPKYWKVMCNLDARDDAAMGEIRREELYNIENRVKVFAGDLRRMEADMLDERSICMQIAHRTGLDKDTVATVLKEFYAI